MVANQTEFFKLEQKSLIKFLVAKKCKSSEVYKRICNEYEEACFSKKMFTWFVH